MLKRIVSIILSLFILMSIVPVQAYATESNDASSTLFSGGSGTADDPYIIRTVEDFVNIRTSPSCHFSQIGDINFENVAVEPIGSNQIPFSGVYDGCGFSIKNVTIDTSEYTYLGLFGYSTGTIKNLDALNCSIAVSQSSNTMYVGIIAGYNRGTLLKCSVMSDISAKVKGESTRLYCGGICGYTVKTIEDCTFSGVITADVAYANSTVYAGGICGYGAAQNSINSGTVTASATATSDAYAGGIVAYGMSAISNCLNSGKVSAINADTAFAGGIAGYQGSTVTGSKNTGEIYANTKYSYSETYSGGIVGHNRGTTSFCENSGTIHGDSSSSNVRVGGIVGMNDKIVEDCINVGTVYGESTSNESRIGGIVGSLYSNGTISRCCNQGAVTTTLNGPFSCGFAGGIVGISQYSTVLQCCNHGIIHAIQKNGSLISSAGGIMGGSSDSAIFDCYNTGTVHQTYNGSDSRESGGCGGIVGEGEISALYCYNVGDLEVDSPHTPIGGIASYCNTSSSMCSIEYCYALSAYQDAAAIEMTEDASFQKETYVGFDFDTIWDIDEQVNDGRPYLRTLPTTDNVGWYIAPNTTISVAGIVIPESIIVAVGDVASLEAMVLPGNATDRTVIWSTDHAEIASVSQEGTVCAISVGTAFITATTADGQYTASCMVTVNARVANEYELKKLTLRDLTGNQLSVIPKASFWATVAIKNLASEGNSLVLLATYDADGLYLGMNAAWVEDIPVGSTVNVSFLLSNSNGKIAEIKAFCIASFSNLTPLGGCLSFPQ